MRVILVCLSVRHCTVRCSIAPHWAAQRISQRTAPANHCPRMAAGRTGLQRGSPRETTRPKAVQRLMSLETPVLRSGGRLPCVLTTVVGKLYNKGVIKSGAETPNAGVGDPQEPSSPKDDNPACVACQTNHPLPIIAIVKRASIGTVLTPSPHPQAYFHRRRHPHTHRKNFNVKVLPARFRLSLRHYGIPWILIADSALLQHHATSTRNQTCREPTTTAPTWSGTK